MDRAAVSQWPSVLGLFGRSDATFIRNELGLNDRVAGGRFPVYRQHLAQLIAATEGGGQPAAFTAFEADRAAPDGRSRFRHSDLPVGHDGGLHWIWLNGVLLSTRAIQEERNLETLVGEILEAATTKGKA